MFDPNINAINQSLGNFAQSADRISKGGENMNIDLAKENVSHIQDSHAIGANIKIIQALDDAQKSLLDILA